MSPEMGAGNNDPDGEPQDQGASAEQNGGNAGPHTFYVSDTQPSSLTAPRVFITKNPACRTPWSLCDLNRKRRQDVKKYAQALRNTAQAKADSNHCDCHRVVSV